MDSLHNATSDCATTNTTSKGAGSSTTDNYGKDAVQEDHFEKVRPWTGGSTSSLPCFSPDRIPAVLSPALEAPIAVRPDEINNRVLKSAPTRKIELNAVKASWTEWEKLPSSGRFAFNGLKKNISRQYACLAKDGNKLHLRTRAQKQKKKLIKIRKEQRKRQRKLQYRDPRDVAGNTKPPKTYGCAEQARAAKLHRCNGLTRYAVEFREKLTNYYHISVSAATKEIWLCLQALHFKTGKDGKELLPMQSEDPILRPPLGPIFACKRALYFRFYRRLFVFLRSVGDGLSIKKCKSRVKHAEELVGVIEKPKTQSVKTGILNDVSPFGGQQGSAAMMSVLSLLQRKKTSDSHTKDGKEEPKKVTKAQARWKLIQKDVRQVMSWRDLLKKRKDVRAAKAATEEELKDGIIKLAEKDWISDSSVRLKEHTWEEGSSWYSLGEEPSSLIISSDCKKLMPQKLTTGAEVKDMVGETSDNPKSKSDEHRDDAIEKLNLRAPDELFVPSISASVQIGNATYSSSSIGDSSSAVIDPVKGPEVNSPKKPKRMRSINEKQFRNGLIDIAWLYCDDSSAASYARLLTQLREVVFYDITEADIQAAQVKQQKMRRNQPKKSNGKPKDGTNKGQHLPTSPSAAAAQHDFQQWRLPSVGSNQLAPRGWVQRRSTDLLAIQMKGRQKLWETSCRVESPASAENGSKYRLDWGRGGSWAVSPPSPSSPLFGSLSEGWPHMSNTSKCPTPSRSRSSPHLAKTKISSYQRRASTAPRPRHNGIESRRMTMTKTKRPELLEKTLMYKHLKTWKVGFGGTISSPSRSQESGYSSPW